MVVEEMVIAYHHMFVITVGEERGRGLGLVGYGTSSSAATTGGGGGVCSKR